MESRPKTIAAILTVGLALIPLSIASAGLGGPKCPPRRGLITQASPSAIGTTAPLERNVPKIQVVVFVDDADHRVYEMNVTDTARAHIGHRVTLIAHPRPRHPNVLFVHEIRCAEHR